MGGLGNQMFQYAFGRMLAEKNNTQVLLDLSSFKKQQVNITTRKYELDIFNLNTKIATKNDKRFIAFPSYRFKEYLINMLSKLFVKNINKIQYIKEISCEYNPDIILDCDNIYLEGYWQSEKYFKDIESIIRSNFNFNLKAERENEIIGNKILSEYSVSIHIRRGDYVNNYKTNIHHGECSLEYYEDAISLINKKVKDPVYYIFSDDIEWAKRNIKMNVSKTFINNNNGRDYEDLRLMSQCRHNIIANSSFSWWGAWLNNNPDKIIIAPKRWFNDKSINTNDIIPKEWIKI